MAEEAAVSGDDTYEASKFLNYAKHSAGIDLCMEYLSVTFSGTILCIYVYTMIQPQATMSKQCQIYYSEKVFTTCFIYTAH